MRVLIACIITILSASACLAHGLNDYEVGEKRQFLWETGAFENDCEREARLVQGKLHRQNIGWDDEKGLFYILDASTESGQDGWTLERYYFGTHPLRKVVVTIHEPDDAAREQGHKQWAQVYMEFTRAVVEKQTLSIKADDREDRTLKPEKREHVDHILLDACSVSAARHLAAAFEALCWWTRFSETAKPYGVETQQ